MDIEFIYSLFKKCEKGVTTDSRKCEVGSMFIALKGENFDGNEFVEKSIENGCKYALTSDKERENGSTIFYVEDTLKCLQDLARYHRRQFDIPVLGITGTNGKTTTKELTAAVIGTKYNTLYTQGNLNNHIGVPLTLLGLNKSVEFAIIEMGANHPGEIQTLVNIAEPTHGLITNVGRAHLQGFGSFEGVVNTKCEMYDYLKKIKGHIFVNASNTDLLPKIEDYENVTIYRREGSICDGRVADCNPYLVSDYGEGEVQTKLVGSYNIENILTAVAVGRYFGVEEDKIKEALENYIPSNNRSQLKQGKYNQLIVDAYNANPTSMTVSVKNLLSLNVDEKTLILGDMKELGECSEEEHRKILDLIPNDSNIHIVLVGNEFKKVARDGMMCYEDVDKFISEIEKNPIKNQMILIKGSNSMKLYKLAEIL